MLLSGVLFCGDVLVGADGTAAPSVAGPRNKRKIPPPAPPTARHPQALRRQESAEAAALASAEGAASDRVKPPMTMWLSWSPNTWKQLRGRRRARSRGRASLSSQRFSRECLMRAPHFQVQLLLSLLMIPSLLVCSAVGVFFPAADHFYGIACCFS